MTTRRCDTCREWKPLSAFALKANYQLRGICTICEPPVPPRIRSAMCSTKVRYKTQERALGVAQSAARRTELMRVYECPLCHGWHLTHKRERNAS